MWSFHALQIPWLKIRSGTFKAPISARRLFTQRVLYLAKESAQHQKQMQSQATVVRRWKQRIHMLQAVEIRSESIQFAPTVWPSGLRRWLKAPLRKGVGSNPAAVTFSGKIEIRGFVRGKCPAESVSLGSV